MLDVVNFQGNFVLVGTGNLDTNHDGQLTAGEGPQTRLDPLTGSLVLDLSVNNPVLPDQLVFQGLTSVSTDFFFNF